MKNIACIVALGLAAVSAQAESGGQPLFSIASEAAVQPAQNAVSAEKAVPESAKKVSLKAGEKSAAQPLFKVEGAQAPVTDAGDKSVAAAAAPAAVEPAPAALFKVSAEALADSSDTVAADKPASSVAKTDKDAPQPADKRESITLPVQTAAKSVAAEKADAQPVRTDVAVAVKETADSTPAQSLFKVASYYEADEMGDSDDAVRKIDFSKPLGQQLPSDAQAKRLADEQEAIQGSKAIALSGGNESKQRKTTKGSYSYVVRGKRYQTLASSENFVQEGSASWYGPGFHGRKTASGEIYDMNKLTAAHKRLPLGTKLEVTNKRTGKSVIVTVNDRGPFHGNRILDLSHAAARQLGLVQSGVGEVSIRAIK